MKSQKQRKSKYYKMKSINKYLKINSAFSGLSGLILLMLSDKISVLFDINNPMVFLVIGINLIVFAIFVYYVSFKKNGKKVFVNWIIALDILWVIASFIIVVGHLFNISLYGHLIITCVAIIVGYLGIKQYTYRNF